MLEPADDVLKRIRIIVIGAQKGASTAIAGALSRNPDVYLPSYEVPLFEGESFTPENREAVAQIFRRRTERLIGIKRPDLLADKLAPKRIATTAPSASVIAVLRDPIERAKSAYWWYLQNGLIPALPIASGLATILDHVESGTAHATHRRASEILTFGHYGGSLERYVEALGRERMIILLPDDLRNRTWAKVLSGALAIEAPLVDLERENQGVYSVQRGRWLSVRRRLLPDARRSDYYARRRMLVFRLARVASAGIVGVDRYLLRHLFADDNPALPEQLLHRLRQYYTPDHHKLEALMQRRIIW